MDDDNRISRDIIITYFTSYSNNEFQDPKKFYYPKCGSINKEVLTQNVYQLSKHMIDRGLKSLGDYASLGWMYNLLPKTADSYEDAIRCYYFAVCTCRDIDESQLDRVTSNYYQDFWSNDLIVLMKEDVGTKDNKRLQKAYMELSKLIFLPFLYGYEWTIIFKIPIYNKIAFDLIKVSDGVIPTPSDIREVVKAILRLGGLFHNPDTSDSPFLRSQVDEYVKLFDAKTECMKKKRKTVIDNFTSFKKKQKKIYSDPDLNMYLTIFMNTVTGSYRVAEMMASGRFEPVKKDKSFGVHSFKHFLDLVPVIGIKLHQLASQIDSMVKDAVEEAIEERTFNTTNSFYNKEIEKITEYVCITYLYDNEVQIKAEIEEQRAILEEEEKKQVE